MHEEAPMQKGTQAQFQFWGKNDCMFIYQHAVTPGITSSIMERNFNICCEYY